VKYISTRENTEPVTFKESVMMGLARDGGLLVPCEIPNVSDNLNDWMHLSFQELALEIISIFADDISKTDLKIIIDESYANFRDDEIAPHVKVGDFYILELFHGPTLAFKDIALQFLGNVFSYILQLNGGSLNILGATSGDTGSAAIYGVKGKPNINIFIMHPTGRVSPIQEMQMTSVIDKNVFNIGINGTFDDCQYIMKSTFSDLDFKDKYNLGAINSVNWSRVLAQIVYYFYSGLKIMKNYGSSAVRFSVPTGNFGNIFAGYLSAKMGLPIKELLLATNENDILSRFFNHGDYTLREVLPTVSPSMDIQLASNFERYLFLKFNQHESFRSFIKHGICKVEKKREYDIDPIFKACKGTTEETLNMIRKYYKNHNYVLDPHSALGVLAAEKVKSNTPTICLATAHPAKFSNTINDAIGMNATHEVLEALKGRPTQFDNVENDVDSVKQYLVDKLNNS
tara:strand:+ start:930 stop:2300 length:1371 start_codon:yes stop_codon:yes gene_type:complete